jgi:hypothetical protein
MPEARASTSRFQPGQESLATMLTAIGSMTIAPKSAGLEVTASKADRADPEALVGMAEHLISK